MSTFRRYSAVVLLASAAFFALVALPVSAAGTTPAKGFDTGLETTAKEAFGATPTKADLPTVIGFFIKSALSLVGLVFMILIVYGGILWMTAAGNEQRVEKAKSIITSAVIGMVIIAAGYALTDFVLRTVITATGQGTS